MWIKYVGEKPYTSLELKKIKPKEKRDIKPEVAKRLVEKYPRWFKICKAPAIIKVIKEAPAVIADALKSESKKEEEVKDDINIEEVKEK